ncbi:hypothetical protein FHW88_002773 [Mucilaginibacter sp. SG538B]|uniref:hypothetical protein n=1 Tax=Mucilaginibacter sp. SG538B TaxID=2587021 RepID=UPI00159DD3B1|nr:hypothetical protein [Mucilaginibacter sp. SG538B]NVM64484.1 hypothetical protein [Mucilaginibacter sp. SG538B]
MGTIAIKYSPSVNILRDREQKFDYIQTANAQKTFQTVFNSLATGAKSHIIIGAYGTGKSSFLLAFEQTISGKANYFNDKHQLPGASYQFLNIVGEYDSLERHIASLLNLSAPHSVNDILAALDHQYILSEHSGKGLIIVIDEFGKFLEYAAKTNPASEIYFLQQLAEWANDQSKNVALLTVLHQNFSAYSLSLNNLQRQEWEKVKGRFKELPFNEPVEQLLFLASERLNEKFPIKVSDKIFDKLFKIIADAKVFPLKNYFAKDFASKLYPFDILSAAVLTLALQKYGQNERSLFSFIETIGQFWPNSLKKESVDFISVTNLYDLLLNDHYTFLTSKYNPDHAQWSAMRRTLERIEGVFSNADQQHQAESLIKLIGLLNIFATYSARLEPQFYYDYAKLALGIKQPEDIIRQLDKRKLIRFVSHNFRYVLFESTDLDIEVAIDNAGKLVEKVTNIVNHLNQYFEFPFISARAEYFRKGTPRFFQFKLTEAPVAVTPEGEIDGFINLIFSESPEMEAQVKEFSSKTDEAILYGCYRNTSQIKEVLFDIQKVKKVIESNQDDRVALKLLDEELQIKIKQLNHYVLDSLYSDKKLIKWYFAGKPCDITNRQTFNQILSGICKDVYPDAPVYKNELINKARVSGQIALARNKLNLKLLQELNLANVGFTDQEFPPEKSIYLSLLRHTGIHRIIGGQGYLGTPTDTSFLPLWEAGLKFLQSTKSKARSIEEFIHVLSAKPYKLKQGLIDYWIPIFLLANRDEYALYANQIYVPEIEYDVLELLNKKPMQFTVKAFNIDATKLKLFNQYRILINQPENSRPTNRALIQTIKPFLVFYRDLPDYCKKTERLSKKTLALRKVIELAKDPEKAFFEDFPAALGYSLEDLQKNTGLAEVYIKQIQDAIREIRSSYDLLIDRFESHLKSSIGTTELFPAYRDVLKERYNKIKFHLLLSQQKPFITRLQSDLDDRTAWLSALAQACVGKPLASINDNDEVLLFDRFKDLLYELDNLNDLHLNSVDPEKEEVIKIELTSVAHGLNKGILRISNEQIKEAEAVSSQIKTILGSDIGLNLAVLTGLLKDYLNEQKG